MKNPTQANKATPSDQEQTAPKDFSGPIVQSLASATQDIQSNEARKMLLKRVVSFSDTKPEHTYCISLNGQKLASLGNIGMIIGKAKSRKSFLVSSLVASCIKGNHLGFESALPAGKTRVLYFDTEQGSFHVWQLVQGIVKMGGKNEHPENLNIFKLRGLTPEQMISLIDEALMMFNDVGLVVIDGIKDLIYDINNPVESTNLSVKLMKWSEEYHVHISCILHQNKGNEQARGHIGTEMLNRSEYILAVSVNRDDDMISEVVCTEAREMKPAPFAFGIDEDRHTFICEMQTNPTAGRPPANKNAHQDKIIKCFDTPIEKLSYKILVSRIMESFAIAESTAKRKITDLTKDGLIIKIKNAYTLPD